MSFQSLGCRGLPSLQKTAPFFQHPLPHAAAEGPPARATTGLAPGGSSHPPAPTAARCGRQPARPFHLYRCSPGADEPVPTWLPPHADPRSPETASVPATRHRGDRKGLPTQRAHSHQPRQDTVPSQRRRRWPCVQDYEPRSLQHACACGKSHEQGGQPGSGAAPGYLPTPLRQERGGWLFSQG